MTHDTSSRIGKILPWFIVVVGAGFRAAQYLGNRSLWGDEVAIALNLRLRTLSELLHPLSYDQTMPVGLLLGFKCVTKVLGHSELALRLPSFLAGCALLVLTWVLLSKIFECRVVLLTVTLMAVSEPLIYYSAELKQYEFDTLVTLLVFWLGISTLKSTIGHSWPWLIIGGAVAMLFSQPVIFVLASIGIAAVFDRCFRSSDLWRKYCFLAAAVWLGVFCLLVWFSYRFTMRSEFMRAFWAPSFIRVGSPEFHSQLSNSLVLLMGTPHVLHVRTMVLGGLFSVGLFGMVRRLGGLVALVAAAPFGLVLLAAMLREYPFATRLLMFTVPLLMLIYASGISLVAEIVPGYSNLAFVLLACAFVLPSAIETGRQTLHFNQREGTRDLARTIAASNHMDAVYLVFGKYKEWEYYAGDWRHPQLVKQRIDVAHDCLRSAQLGYQETSGCQSLEFLDLRPRWDEIVGNPPPAPSAGVTADQTWAEQEAARIAGTRATSLWLFLPVYNDNAINGFPKQRKLLEKLQSQLEKVGCSPLQTDVKGDSVAQNFRCNGSKR